MNIIKVLSARGEIEDFKKSIIWKDIRRELVMWKKGFETEMKGIVEHAADTNPSTASVLLHMGDLNGRMKAVDYMLSIPDIFLQIVEDQINDSRRDKADRPSDSE